jgi:hypothetical protein
VANRRDAESAENGPIDAPTAKMDSCTVKMGAISGKTKALL